MKDWVTEEAETELNSPDKNFQLSNNRPPSSPAHLMPRWQSAHGTRLSLTEQQIYSRSIVREVLRTRKMSLRQSNTRLSGTTSTECIMGLSSTLSHCSLSHQNSTLTRFRQATSCIPQFVRPKVAYVQRSPSHQHCNCRLQPHQKHQKNPKSPY